MSKKLIEVAANHELRGYILKLAHETQPLGAGLQFLEIVLHQLKFNITSNDVANACQYLEGKGLVRIERVSNQAREISRDIVHITSKGIDVMEGTETTAGIELVGD